MTVGGVLALLCVILGNTANAEWLLTHTLLPAYCKNHPESFLIHLGWVDDEQGETTNVTLNLVKSEVVGRNIPLFTNLESGATFQLDLLDLKHSMFYHDLDTLASFSLTSFSGEGYRMTGSFVRGESKYQVEPYHPGRHRRDIGGEMGDHIIRKCAPSNSEERIDFIWPDEDSEDYERLQRCRAKFNELEKLRQLHLKEKTTHRERRQSLPDTTYIVQLYIIVDYYAYLALNDMHNKISWPGNVDDFIAFYIGHEANEVDMRYRNVDSNIDPIYKSWTIGTKFSYLNVAKTTGASLWTYPPTNLTNLYMDASIGLNNVKNWASQTADLPSDADHYALLTGLDIYFEQSLSTAGLAYVGGACNEHRTSINELGKPAVYAHEIGHNLGAYHDGSSNACSADDDFIMSPVSGTTNATKGNSWKFSPCSVEYFDTYISSLDTDGIQCLNDSGSYVSTWADDYTGYIGQIMDVDIQCKEKFGDNYVYSKTYFDRVCYALWCSDGSYSRSKGAALPYTSCGSKKWCVEELCVSDQNAPAMDENCPFGDSEGKVFSNSDTVCANITGRSCGASNHAQQFCCQTCPTFQTRWLGPSCEWGDQASWCDGISNISCLSNGVVCCDSCCPVNGAASGYSCSPPPTTIPEPIITPAASATTTAPPSTSQTTISGEPETTQTLSTITTQAPPTTSTQAPPTTSTQALPTTSTQAPPTTSTQAPPTTSTQALPTTSTQAPPTTSTQAPPTTSTQAPPTTSVQAPPTTSIQAPPTTEVTKQAVTTISSMTTKPTKGLRKKRFRCGLRIARFFAQNFLCNDPAFSDPNSDKFQEITLVICQSIKRNVKKVTMCQVFHVSCGSFIVNTTLEVEESVTDSAVDAAPANQEEFLLQISGIMNDTELIMAELPTIEDVNECMDPSLNHCSPHATCTNTDGYYDCTCNSDYPVDLSEYADEAGRICAKSCEGFCNSGETCAVKPEADPTCTCSGDGCDVGPPVWVYVLIGVAVAVALMVIAVLVVVLVKKFAVPNKVYGENN